MVKKLMPLVSFQETLPYRATDLYDLVMAVERYPEIFPDIKSVRIVNTGENSRSVDVTVQAPFTSFQYSCDVTGERPSKISIRATGGAFKSMDAAWYFDVLPDGRTRVRYTMNFDFGGFGLKNMVAETFIKQSMERTRAQLRAYAAQNLAAVSLTTAPRPQGP